MSPTDTHHYTLRPSKGYRCLAAMIAFLFAFAPTIPIFAETSGASANLSPKAHKASGDSNENYPILRIGPGDLLSIFVYGENAVSTGSGMAANTQLPTDYQVDSGGVIVFPFFGKGQAGRPHPRGGQREDRRALSKPRKVSVLIKESNTYWVSILGNVAKPGRYQIAGKPTLLSALAEAGGPLPGTDMGGAILIHSDMKLKVNLDKFLTGEGRMETEPYLYPGDTLMVQKSPWPDLGSIAIVASILASAAVLTVELSQLRHN